MQDPGIDVAYELIVLRGPRAPAERGITGGAVGSLLDMQASLRKAVIALAIGFFTGVGGTLAWAYASGEARGLERAEVRQLRKDLDELRARGTWTPPAVGVTTAP